jgi:glycosyltransferase involved in cell wall biosynthesis
VDLNAFKPRPKDAELARDMKLEGGVPTVGLVANYGPWKGQGIFLKAAGLLKRQGRPAVFILAGRDTESQDLKAATQAEGLTEKDVRFLGFYQDVPRLLSLLDVSVNAATEGEGLSGALRESLAMEVPVVASDIGGNRELVLEGKTGRLFPPGDAAALAQALDDILSDPGAAKLTAQAGRAKVKESFSLERMISATADLYRSLLKERA